MLSCLWEVPAGFNLNSAVFQQVWKDLKFWKKITWSMYYWWLLKGSLSSTCWIFTRDSFRRMWCRISAPCLFELGQCIVDRTCIGQWPRILISPFSQCQLNMAPEYIPTWSGRGNNNVITSAQIDLFSIFGLLYYNIFNPTGDSQKC